VRVCVRVPVGMEVLRPAHPGRPSPPPPRLVRSSRVYDMGTYANVEMVLGSDPRLWLLPTPVDDDALETCRGGVAFHPDEHEELLRVLQRLGERADTLLQDILREARDRYGGICGDVCGKQRVGGSRGSGASGGAGVRSDDEEGSGLLGGGSV
jgi:hypothetical protein